jgi:MazG family protein
MQKKVPAGSAGDAAEALVRLMERLRKECPWDRKQTFQTLSGYLLEESYETLDALARGDFRELEGELGDLLFEIVFLAELGRERGEFDFASVARRIHDKMVARHPHVFGEAAVHDAEGVRVQWEELKRKEREKEGRPPSPFDGVPRALPALLKAVRLTSRAADLGFDWERDADVLAKLDEEVAEFKARRPPTPTQPRTRPASPGKSATSSSRSSTSPAATASTPRRRCRARTTSSGGGSRRSRGGPGQPGRA